MAMVIDLNKCIGCQTCTVACKTQWTNRNGREYMYWNNVETHPGQGYPRDWQNKGGGFTDGELQPGIIPDLAKDYGIPWNYNHDQVKNGVQFKPHTDPKWGPNWDEDQGAGNFPKDNYFFYIPRICNHCTNPGCLSSCPRDAIFKRSEDGMVLVDLDRCQGYRYCVAGCPYKKIYFNPKIGKSEKCIMCFPRVEKGLPTACAQQCVGRVRLMGFLDDKEGQVYKLVKEHKVAIPLRPDRGTSPNVYYIPPSENPPKFDANGNPIKGSSRIPKEYLTGLFGEGVHDVIAKLKGEIEKKKKGRDSEILDMLIGYKHSDMFRLDSNYYKKVAHDKKEKPAPLVDNRYIVGKNTKKFTNFFENMGGHH